MNQRPVNLNLATIRFPITALISITHRLSGIFLFLLIPTMIWLLDRSLVSSASFEQVSLLVSSPIVKIIVWLGLSALYYHLIAGIRHLLMDFHCIKESLFAAKVGSVIIAALSVIASLICLFKLFV